MADRRAINEALAKIFEGIEGLRAIYAREFTIDGRLVGDIGEMLASLDYDIRLDEVQRSDHDGMSSDGRRVQIKATFKDSLTFKTVTEVYLVLKLYPNGTYDEVFNGPPDAIVSEYSHRKGFGRQLLSFPISRLRELGEKVPVSQRVARRQVT